MHYSIRLLCLLMATLISLSACQDPEGKYNAFKERKNTFLDAQEPVEEELPMIEQERIPNITSGKYNIFWRALSPDGHIIKGKSEFEVK